MNKEPAIVSVVIPVYNKRRYLRRALHSVLQQTEQDVEIILVDDGSTDGSLDTVYDIKDPRIRYVRQSNAGVSAARNTGVKLSRSPLIAFLDADDAWEPEFLEAMLALTRRYPSAGLYASGYRVQVAGQPARPARVSGLPLLRRRFLSKDYFRLSTRGELPISASSVLIPRRVLMEMGGFPEGEGMGEDQHVWWRICSRHAFAYDKRYLSTYYQDAAERTCPANVPEEELAFSRRLREELPGLRLSLWQRWHAYRYMGAHLLYLSRENLKAGKTADAVKLLQDQRTRLLPLKWLLRRLQVAVAA